MIVCHQYRFIFVKTRKTAGSSAEIALSRLCSVADIVTPLSPERGEEELRAREGGYGPTGHRKPLSAHRGFKEWRRLLTRGQKASYGPHLTAEEIQRLVGTAVWDNYLKVTIERNPWDRALSRYWWQKHRWEEKERTGFPGLREYLEWLEANKPHWLTNWGHYTINDEVAVDRVLFYENLDEELRGLASVLGIEEEQLRLPRHRAKGGLRKDSRPYQEVLGPDEKGLIERVCQGEIQAFDYKF